MLDLSARYRFSEKIDARVFYRLYRSKLDDYHQQGLVPLVNQNLYLATIDDDFTAHVIGTTVTLRY